MFRLLAMFLAAKRAEADDRDRQPWTCPECGRVCASAESRRHSVTHRARTLSADPLIVELRCHPADERLAEAVRELRERWPDRKFALLPASYGRTSVSDVLQLYTVLAVAV
ncbi:MAG TPA: hypothetical protein VLC10_03440 [Patescibacteria group bacterium]|nr:hypothetical protein [Patescibacteria group bacterium]